MLCGSKWKSCDCEWFNFGPVEGLSNSYSDERVDLPIEELSESDGSPSPQGVRARASQRDARVRRHGREAYRRRLQVQRDEELARQLHYDMTLQNRSLEDDDEDDEDEDGDDIDDDDDDVYDMTRASKGGSGLGLSSGRHKSEHHRHGSGRYRTRHSPPSPPGYDRPMGYRTPPRAAYDRGGYVMDVNRARGFRADSMERRLADRLSEHRQGGPPPPLMAAGYHMAPHPAQAGMDVPGMMPQAVPPPPMGPFSSMPGPPIGLPTSSSAPMMTAPPPPHPFSSVSHHHSPVAASTAHFSGPPMVDYPPPMTGRAPMRRRESDGGAAPRSSSSMAGLSAPGNGTSRVSEWITFVEPGLPEAGMARVPEERLSSRVA